MSLDFLKSPVFMRVCAGCANGNEATDPSDPEKPVDPEEPTDPEKPVDPEEPSNPEEPSKPEEPSNPGTEIPADTVDSVVQEIEQYR